MEYKKFEDRQKSPAKRFLFILGVVMFSVYFVLGMLIIFWDNFPLLVGVEKVWKIAFAAILIAYSFIRFIRLIRER